MSNSLSREQKEQFDKLSARTPFTISSSAIHEHVLTVRMRAQIPYQSWKQLLRPCSLGIIGLAIGVALWGVSYKLSLYHHRGATSARASVAKLWIEPRRASLAAGSRLKSKSHHVTGPQALSVTSLRLPNLGGAGVKVLALSTRGVTYFDFLIPSRSPPQHRFCLA
jgi:hypothetical protein